MKNVKNDMEEMKMSKKVELGPILGIIAVLVLLIGGGILLFGFDTVDASHKGVMIKFGEIQGTMEPGLKWTGPFVNVEQYNLKLRKMSVAMEGNQGAVDKDGQAVFADIEINYRINPLNVERMYSEVGWDNNNQLETTLNLNGIVREGFKSVKSQYSSLEIFQKRPEIKQKAIEKIKENFPEDFFILDNVIISNIDFNTAFKSAIESKKVAEEMAKAKEKEVEVAKMQAEISVAEAEGSKQVRMKEAEANAYIIQKQAEAEANALRMKKEQLTPLMVQNNWIDKWDGQVPFYMFGDTSNTDLLLEIPQVEVE